MVKLVLKYCVQKELLNLKDLKLTQNFYGNKTGFVRLGHILLMLINQLSPLINGQLTGDEGAQH